jgi:hypothetical protein
VQKNTPIRQRPNVCQPGSETSLDGPQGRPNQGSKAVRSMDTDQAEVQLPLL